MKKYFIHLLSLLILFTPILTFQSCQQEDTLADSTSIQQSSNQESADIASIDNYDLKHMKEHLQKSGVDVSSINIDEVDNPLQTKATGLVLRAIKVSCKTTHPSGTGLIDVSGVLLVPKKNFITSLFNYRILVAAPGTYTHNNVAPSNAFKGVFWSFTNDFQMNTLYFYSLQAASGFAVLIPDYPGFGDSYGQCFPPYLEKTSIVGSTIDLIKAAQHKLSAEGYRYKKELLITGYSQGGFVATSLTRELETNPRHNLTVKGLVSGGTPCNLKQIVDIVRQSESVVHTYFLPYAIWGFKKNKYPYLEVNKIFNEPYASTSYKYYDGTYSNVNDKFSHNISDVYTHEFIHDLDTDPSYAYMNQILQDNSIKPWKNQCRIIMTHGVKDVSVYYQNAIDFAYKQRKIGGEVLFYPTLGDHVGGFFPYFGIASIELKKLN